MKTQGKSPKSVETAEVQSEPPLRLADEGRENTRLAKDSAYADANGQNA